MANSTTTVTQTFTSTHTTIQQLPAANVFGFPPEIFLAIFAIFALIIYAYFRLQVKTVPVQVLWLYKNFSAKLFRAQENLAGVFVNIQDARGKVIERLEQAGVAIEMDVVNPKAKWYIIPKSRSGTDIEQPVIDLIEEKGYKIQEQPGKKRGKRMGYVLTRPESKETKLGFLDITAGGLKRIKMFMSVEGSGVTVDVAAIVTGEKGKSAGTAALIHEEIGATKEFLHLLGAALRGTIGQLLLPLLAGVSLGGLITFMLVIFTGHFH